MDLAKHGSYLSVSFQISNMGKELVLFEPWNIGINVRMIYEVLPYKNCLKHYQIIGNKILKTDYLVLMYMALAGYNDIQINFSVIT